MLAPLSSYTCADYARKTHTHPTNRDLGTISVYMRIFLDFGPESRRRTLGLRAIYSLVCSHMGPRSLALSWRSLLSLVQVC